MLLTELFPFVFLATLGQVQIVPFLFCFLLQAKMLKCREGHTLESGREAHRDPRGPAKFPDLAAASWVSLSPPPYVIGSPGDIHIQSGGHAEPAAPGPLPSFAGHTLESSSPALSLLPQQSDRPLLKPSFQTPLPGPSPAGSGGCCPLSSCPSSAL